MIMCLTGYTTQQNIHEKYEFELFIKCMIGTIIFVALTTNVKISF